MVQPGTGVSISSNELNYNHYGDEKEIDVDTAVDGAAWYAYSTNSWITVSPTSGNGDSNVVIQVAPYCEIGTRQGSAMIAGEEVVVFQRGRDMRLGNEVTNVTADAQTVQVEIEALDDVIWDVMSCADWISIQETGTGVGSSEVAVAIDENYGYNPRAAEVKIGSETFYVTQAATTNMALSVKEANIASAGGTVTVDVACSEIRDWIIKCDADWITMEGNSSRTGPALLTIQVIANSGLDARSCEIVIGDEVMEISQKAASTTVVSDVLFHGVDIDIGKFEVAAPDYLVWSAMTEADWIILTYTGSTNGNAEVEYVIDDLGSVASRRGIIWVGKTPVYVYQQNPSLIDPIPEIDADASPSEIAVALNGSADEKLVSMITDAENYTAYRTWSESVKDTSGAAVAGQQAVKDSPHAWLSFALGSESLIGKSPAEGDIKIDNFEPSKTSGKYEFEVSIEDVTVGSGATEENIKKVFGIEGSTEIGDNTKPFSAENVGITLAEPKDGKIKFTAGPTEQTATRFFMKVKMK